MKKKITLKEISGNKKETPFNILCKIYNDGSHYVAIEKKKRVIKNIKPDQKYDKSVYEFFNNAYVEAMKQGIRGKKIIKHLLVIMESKYPDIENLEDFVKRNAHRMYLNYHNRVKRVRRKAYLNKWNYFVTITYDDKKHNEESFRQALKKCLSNLASRRNYKYMGVWERGKVEGRLHFHAIMYIPDNEMVGKLKSKKSYSERKKCIQTTMENSFFKEKFGINDFEKIGENDIKFGNVLDYLIKYIFKDNEKIVYSRGITDELVCYVDKRDIAVEYVNFGLKLVLFDDCIIDGKYKPFNKRKLKQITMFEMQEKPIRRNYKNTKSFKFLKASGINKDLVEYANNVFLV